MNKTVGIIGGIALVGVVGYMIYSRNKAMSSAQSEPSMDDADKSTPAEDQTTSGSTTEPIVLKNKKITKSDDLKGTPLGTFLSIDLISDDGKVKMNQVISSFNTAEKTVLDYAALATDNERNSGAYNTALNTKFGSKAAGLKNNVISRLQSATGFKKIQPKGATGVGKLVEKISGIFGGKAQDKVETVLEDRRERKACRKAAQQSCGRKLRAKKCRKDFRKKCIAEGGYDEGGEDFASFSSSKLSSELEDFAFNGHTF